MHPTRPALATLGLTAALLIVGLQGSAAIGADRPGSRAVPAQAVPAQAVPAQAVPAQALPACEYRDEPTRYGKVREWPRTLLDTNLKLRRSYQPWDLVPVSRAGLRGSGLVRQSIIGDLTAMAAAARRAGVPLAARSAYRSYQTQVATFASWVQRSGYEQALKYSARPGHSEHQLGTTIDFTTALGVPLRSTFGESPAGRWLAGNGWRYGFVMSYPKGKKRVSCYGHEPWHWRYFGLDVARRIHESGQVPRRFLWETSESVPGATRGDPLAGSTGQTDRAAGRPSATMRPALRHTRLARAGAPPGKDATTWRP